MSLFWMLVCAVGLALLIHSVLNRRKWYLAAQIPGPSLWLPGLGNVADIIYHYGVDSIDWVAGNYGRFGNVYGIWIGSDFIVSTADPRDVEFIVTSSSLINKGSLYNLLSPWLGDGLLLIGGQKWHSRRKLLTPTFHFKILDQFMNVFKDNGAILETKMQDLIGQGAVDVRPYISRHALDVICETAMGTSIHAQLQEDSEYVRAVKIACKSINKRHVYPWLANETLFRMTNTGRQFYKALEVLHGSVNKVIKSRKAELQSELKKADDPKQEENDDKGGKKRKVFLDQLITMHLQGEDLSEKDIFDEVNTFMFEGHDTTMTSVCFTLFLLSKHPEVQERAAQEVINVLVTDSEFTTANLADLKYLDAVIKESLRIYPSVPLIFRHIKNEIDLPSGFTIPANSSVMMNVIAMHRDENNFKNPMKFDPDRFLTDSNESRHHFAYIPFSAGYRNCIGQRFAVMSMKVTIARLLSSFRFRPNSVDADLDLKVDVVLLAKQGVHLIVEKRE